MINITKHLKDNLFGVAKFILRNNSENIDIYRSKKILFDSIILKTHWLTGIKLVYLFVGHRRKVGKLLCS